MALTYSESGIADANFAVLKPIKASQAILLRDNPKASHKCIRRSSNGPDKTGSAALSDDGVLEFTADANQAYSVRVFGVMYTDLDRGFQMALDVPAAATLTVTLLSNSATMDAYIGGFTTADATGIGGVLGTGGYVNCAFILEALVLNGANSGSVKFQYAQSSAGASTCQVLAGTSMVWHRLDDETP